MVIHTKVPSLIEGMVVSHDCAAVLSNMFRTIKLENLCSEIIAVGPYVSVISRNCGGGAGVSLIKVLAVIAREAQRSSSFSCIWDSNRMDKMPKHGRRKLFEG